MSVMRNALKGLRRDALRERRTGTPRVTIAVGLSSGDKTKHGEQLRRESNQNDGFSSDNMLNDIVDDDPYLSPEEEEELLEDQRRSARSLTRT